MRILCRPLLCSNFLCNYIGSGSAGMSKEPKMTARKQSILRAHRLLHTREANGLAELFEGQISLKIGDLFGTSALEAEVAGNHVVHARCSLASCGSFGAWND